MSKKSSLTPFDSKVKEVARNTRMISENIQSSVNVLSMLIQHSQDLEILSMELDLQPMERKAMRSAKGDLENKMFEVLGHLSEAQRLSEEISGSLADEDGYGPYLGREVSNPFTPIFSGKLSSKLIDLGKEHPELKPHLRKILGSIKTED